MNPLSLIKKIFFITALTTTALESTATQKIDTLHAQKTKLCKQITEPFEKKQTKLLAQLHTEIDDIKKDPLYQELVTLFHTLEESVEYQQYTLLTSTINLIADLQAFNSGITQSDLLTKTNDGLDRLHPQKENFSVVRALLKKQRVALIELLDEKDLIESLEKNLRLLQKELSASLQEQKEKLTKTETYDQLQKLQKNYLDSQGVQKIETSLKKLQTLEAQKDIALLKNQEYLTITKQIERLEQHQPPHPATTELTAHIKKTEHELFLIPVEDLL